MSPITRRGFLKTSVAAGALAATGSTIAPAAARRTATDWVTLGNSGVKVTRLAFGTGTHAGRIQRELGQEGFTKLVRYAYDRGIRFFESADTYDGMHEMLAIALKGIPRDTYRLMTKMRARGNETPQQAIDRFRKETNSEYFDILLMHAMRSADWPNELKPVCDQLEEAKQKQVILSHGASIHGILPLRACSGTPWLDIALVRVNHFGTMMDNMDGRSQESGDITEPVANIAKIRGQGTGVIGMKIIGEGRFQDPEQREKSIKFVMGLGTVDAITIGYKSTAEIDEAIERMNRNLNS